MEEVIRRRERRKSIRCDADFKRLLGMIVEPPKVEMIVTTTN